MLVKRVLQNLLFLLPPSSLHRSILCNVLVALSSAFYLFLDSGLSVLVVFVKLLGSSLLGIQILLHLDVRVVDDGMGKLFLQNFVPLVEHLVFVVVFHDFQIMLIL